MTKKTRLKSSQRMVIEEYGMKRIQSTIDRTREGELYQFLLHEANQAIRGKYPESEMAILRKYKLTREDRCLRVQFPSGRVDGINFHSETPVVDIPSRWGCLGDDVFPVTTPFEEAFDEHARLKQENDKAESEKKSSFRAFLAACIYLDEVLEVVPLPDDLRQRLGHRSTALIAVTPETVSELRSTFRQAA